MRLHYTNFPFFNYLKTGVAFPFLFIIALPMLIQEEGCDTKKEEAPACAVMVSPAPGSVDIAESVNITWSAVSGATAYKIRIGTGSGEGDILNSDLGNTTTCKVEGLPANTQIFVNIRPYNQYGQATLCQEYSFTTVKGAVIPPECVALTGPEDGAEKQGLQTAISWEPASNHDGYMLRVTAVEGEWSILNKRIDKNVTSYNEWILPYSQTITAVVVPFNEGGEAENCQKISFTTIDPPPPPPAPACVKLQEPLNGATDVAVSTSIRWERATGRVNGYKLKIGTSPGAGDIEDTGFGSSVVTYKPENPLPEKTKIYVQIIPHNDLDAEGCIEESFTTGEKPSDVSTPPEGAPKYVRKNVAELDFNDPVLVTYRDAVTKMKALPEDHPHNWNRQAKIHHEHCPHGAWFFLPWHRAYLFYFEEAIRAVSGDDSFALPYWDWSKNPKIPAAFWGDDNPLQNDRRQGPDDTPDESYIGQDEIDDILSIEDFGLFASSEFRSGSLESSPHNYVHGWVGGEMGFVNSAARDPLFWCHHANVDRIWAMWNEYGNANTDNEEWLKNEFKGNFFDRDGNPIDVSVEDVVSTYKMGFRYDTQSETEPNTAFQSLPVEYEEIEGMTFIEGLFPPAKINQTFTVNMNPSADFLANVNVLLDAPPRDIPQAVFLFIDSIAPPMMEDVFIKVFVNHDNLTKDTGVRDVHHIESFGFFRMGMSGSNHSGHDHHGDGDMGSFIFDMTPALRAIRETTNAPIDKIEVQLMAVPFSGEASDAMFSPGKFMIQLARRKS